MTVYGNEFRFSSQINTNCYHYESNCERIYKSVESNRQRQVRPNLWNGTKNSIAAPLVCQEVGRHREAMRFASKTKVRGHFNGLLQVEGPKYLFILLWLNWIVGDHRLVH